MSENNKPRKQRKSKEYSLEQLKTAIEKVKNGELSSYRAAKQYGIARSTIENHVRQKVAGFKCGRPAFFNQEQEQLMLDYIITLCKWGYPPNKDEFQRIAKQFARQFNLKMNDKEWVPGEDWLKRYLVK